MIRIRRLIKSFQYAVKGIFVVFREEQNIRVQFFVGVVVVLMGFLFDIARIEWCILMTVIALVMLMEIVNSAVERIVDAMKPRMSSYVKEVKDIMAAAVMFASVFSVVIGVIVFYPYFFELLMKR